MKNVQSEAVRELTLEEEMELYKAEAKSIFNQEDPHSEPSFKNCVIRRGMRIISKASERLKINNEKN